MKLTDYIAGDRRGRAAHDLELEAQRDPFLAEALEGLEPAAAADAGTDRAGTLSVADSTGPDHQVKDRPDTTPVAGRVGTDPVADSTDTNRADTARKVADHAAAIAGLQRRIADRATRQSWRRHLSIKRTAAAAALILATAGVATWFCTSSPDFASDTQSLAGNIPSATTAADFLTGENRGTVGIRDGIETPATAESRNGTGISATAESRDEVAADTATACPIVPEPLRAAPKAMRSITPKNLSKPIPVAEAAPHESPHTISARPDPGPDKYGRNEYGRDEYGRDEYDPSRPVPEENIPGPAPQNPDEVVVVAFGTAPKSAYTGSTGSISGNRAAPASPTPVQNVRQKPEPVGKPEPEQRTAGRKTQTPDDPAFCMAETFPSFQGGDIHAFRRWVEARVSKPEAAPSCGSQGRVMVSFMIDTLGRLTDIQVTRTPDRSLSEEAVRVLKTSPHWEPGRQGDKKVKVKYNMPVDFREQN